MSFDRRGRADFLKLGDWNAVCFQCGRKQKAGTMLRHWEGYYVCPEHWEARQPQDFVRGVPDSQVPAWTQPMPANVFVSGVDGVTATPYTPDGWDDPTNGYPVRTDI